MKKYLSGMMVVVSLGGCVARPCGEELGPQCGSPCPHLMPVAVDDETLLASYRASALGQRLEQQDQLIAARVLQNLLRTGPLDETMLWYLDDVSVPVGSFKVFHPTRQGSAFCLEYIQTLTLEKTLISQGLACQEVNGIWRVVKEVPLETHG